MFNYYQVNYNQLMYIKLNNIVLYDTDIYMILVINYVINYIYNSS